MGIRRQGSGRAKQKTGEGNAGEYFTQVGKIRRVCGDATHTSGEGAIFVHGIYEA